MSHHRHASETLFLWRFEMAFRWQADDARHRILTWWLFDFRGSGQVLLRYPIFCDFSREGVQTPCVPPSGSAHEKICILANLGCSSEWGEPILVRNPEQIFSRRGPFSIIILTERKLLKIRKFSRGFYFRETSRSFVKIKFSRNDEITLFFTDISNQAQSRKEFLAIRRAISLNETLVLFC